MPSKGWGRGGGVGGAGGYSDFYLLHRLTLYFGSQDLKFTSCFGFGTCILSTILGYANLGGYSFGYVILDRYFFGVSFQKKAFCNVFLMYSLIKCSIFTIYASNRLESMKILYIFNNLVAYFCQHHWLQYIQSWYFWGTATLTGIFWGGGGGIFG